VWERVWRYELNRYNWTGPIRIQASDYDSDYVQGNTLLHHQDFGSSVAVYDDTLAVGAPLAAYPNEGSEYVELYATDPLEHKGLARGKVYIYFKPPPVQVGKKGKEKQAHSVIYIMTNTYLFTRQFAPPGCYHAHGCHALCWHLAAELGLFHDTRGYLSDRRALFQCISR